MRLLGAPQVIHNGAPVLGLTSAKAQALLFYLAVTGQMHMRPALAALLWGDMPEATARSNLRKALQQLRECLGAYLHIERDVVGLAEGADCWVDVVEFADLMSDVTPTDAPDLLQRAVALYRGDFLKGFYVRSTPDFERWWLSEQERLRKLMLESLHALADHRAEQGDLDGAISLSRRLLEIEPWHEDAHRSLMAWLALSGQRSAALAQYEICRRALAADLAVEPEEETAALYDRIHKGSLKPQATRTPRLPDVGPRPPAFLDECTETAHRSREHFVGRESQLDRLGGFLETALAGRGQVAFVSGEAGWGKTRLLTEFADRTQEQHPGLIVATGVCTGYAETGDPYLPFREILRTLSGDIEQGWAAGSISRGHALSLWRFLPSVVEALLTHGRHLIDVLVPGELLLSRAAAHDAVESGQMHRLQELADRQRAGNQQTGTDQGRILEEVADVLHTLSQDRTLLLILDDLHWADASSISLLFHLARRLSESPILILGAYRPEEISLGREGKEHPLVGVLAEFKRLFGDIWVNLRQDEEGGRAFVNALLDSEPNILNEEFRLRLAENTRGHPLFTVEALQNMREQGHLDRDESGRWVASPMLSWDALPRRVEGVIERRVSRLDPSLRRALVTASAEGEEFTAEVVARVCSLQDGEMISVLSGELAKRHRLVRAGAVRWSGEKRISSYRFSHNLFQRYLYDTLDVVERTYLHEAIGTALEDLYQGRTEEIAVRLVSHFREAGHLGKTVEYLKQAGDAAARVYANTEAIAHYSQAIDLAQRIEIDAADLSQLYTHLGRSLELDSQFDRVLATYESMEKLARQRGDRRMELASLIARATIRSVPTAVHDPEGAQVLGERALTLAGELADRAAEARILWSLSLAHYFSNQLAQAVDFGERSLALARELGLREQMAQSLNDLGSFIYLYSGRIDPAREALQAASDLWRDFGNAPMLADSLSGSCIAHVYAGDFDRAVACSQEAFQISRSIENLWGQSYSQWTIGDAFAERGEFSRAIEAMEECIRLGKQAGLLPSQTYTRTKLAQVYMELGSLDKAMQLLQEALTLSRNHLPTDIAQGLGVLARLYVRMGDLRGAEAAIKEGRNDPYQESWVVFYLPVLLAEAELALCEGHPSRAFSATEDLITRLRCYGMRSLLPEALSLQAKAYLSLGQDSMAYDRFLETQRAAELIGSRRISWRTLLALSQLEGNPARANSLRREARGVLEFILDRFDIKHAGLRETFLTQAEVRAVFEGN
jgi:predicted ATPase/DNA-binding SARP family transcriptional activator